MPSHNHITFFRGMNSIAPWGVVTNTFGRPADQGEAPAIDVLENTSPSGGNQPHNILPRFMTLAYIMKL